MTKTTCFISAVAIVLSTTSLAFANHGARIVSYGQRETPGVEVEAASHSSAHVASYPSGRGPSGATRDAPSSGSTVAPTASPQPSGAGPTSFSGTYRAPELEWIDYRCSTTPGARGGLDLAIFNDTTRGCITMAEPVVARRPAPTPRARPTAEKQEGPSPEVLARRAFDQAVALAGQPQIGIAPAEVGLTGLESYFWLAERPRPIRATASAGGLSVTAEAAPFEYVWDFGDGADLVTDHPGRPWTESSPGNVVHLYETRGSYEVAVEVVWRARWRSGTGGWQPLGLFSTADGLSYPIRQVQSRLVPSD